MSRSSRSTGRAGPSATTARSLKSETSIIAPALRRADSASTKALQQNLISAHSAMTSISEGDLDLFRRYFLPLTRKPFLAMRAMSDRTFREMCVRGARRGPMPGPRMRSRAHRSLADAMRQDRRTRLQVTVRTSLCRPGRHRTRAGSRRRRGAARALRRSAQRFALGIDDPRRRELSHDRGSSGSSRRAPARRVPGCIAINVPSAISARQYRARQDALARLRRRERPG